MIGNPSLTAGKIYKPVWISLNPIVGRGQAHRDTNSREMLGVWPRFLPVSCALEWIINSLKLLVSHKMLLIQWVGNIRLFPCGAGKLICTGWERPKWQTALEMVQKGKRIKIKRNGSSGKVPNQTSNQSDKSMQLPLSCVLWCDIGRKSEISFLPALLCSIHHLQLWGWSAQACGKRSCPDTVSWLSLGSRSCRRNSIPQASAQGPLLLHFWAGN